MYHSGNELLDPYVLFEQAQLQPGMHMADFGCGRTGHIVFPAAKIIGEDGIIYAVDVLKDVLENIEKRAKMEAFVNIHTIWSNVELVGKTGIPDKTLDIVFCVNVMSQSTNHGAILEEASRLLKDKGRIAVVDWTKKGLSFSPDDSRFVKFEEIKSWARENNFGVQSDFAVGKYHHGVVLYRNS